MPSFPSFLFFLQQGWGDRETNDRQHSKTKPTKHKRQKMAVIARKKKNPVDMTAIHILV